MATSLATLRTRSQVLYDVAGSTVLDSDEWDQLINDSYRKLWRTVTRINKNFRVSTDTFTLTAGTQTRALPATYRETLLVRLNPGTDQQEILHRLTPRVAQSNWSRSYELRGSNLLIQPLQRCAGNYDHLYVPNVTALSADADELDAELDQFAEYLVYDTANVALAREESERVYEIDFQRAEKDVIAWASAQRSAEPDTVEDVRRSNTWSHGAP